MNVFALTPTGNRPEGMALLAEYINAQSYAHAFQWIIVDDCDPATRVPKMREGISVELLRPPWRWEPGQNTQAKSMAFGLSRVPNDAALFVFEDDDVYLPDYMITMREAIACAELVGEKDSYYYNVSSGRWRVLPGKVHSSMASTVCRGAGLTHLKRLCASGAQRMLDVNLWKTFKGSKVVLSAHNVIGIKGLPGRSGIGVGHRRNFGRPDDGSVLREWIGDLAHNYGIFREVA